jgi:hypothetical protein
MKKPMRKTKRFNGADGSTVESDTRTVKGPKPSDYEINPESGEKYLPVDKAAPADTSLISEPPGPKAKKAAPKAAPVKTESKAEVKAESKPEPDNSAYAKRMKEAKNQAPLSRFTSNLGSPYPVDKPKEAPAVKTESKPSYAEKMEAGRNQTSLGKSIRSFFSGKPYGAEKYEREERMKKDLGDGMKAGGKVKSASARADGCAIRGKTRA